MRTSIRTVLTSLALLGAVSAVPAFAQQTSPQTQTTAPAQPGIELPRRGNAPIVDDVMTLGTPTPESNAAASVAAPVVSRPEPRAGSTAGTIPGAAPVQGAFGRIVSGRASVLDGNTLRVGGEIIVLHGADAFEIGQVCTDPTGMGWSCGAKATAHLTGLASGRSVQCVGVENLEGAITANCSIKGEDLGSAMVSEGYSFSAPGTSGLSGLQRQAEIANRGGWSGQFDFPWIYRSAP